MCDELHTHSTHFVAPLFPSHQRYAIDSSKLKALGWNETVDFDDVSYHPKRRECFLRFFN